MRRLPDTVRGLAARFLPGGAVLLSVLLFGSYVMGLLRTRAFAQTFGASEELDAYIAAFVLPEVLLDVLVEAGLAAPFIPIFLKLRSRTDGGADAADAFARTILTAAVTVMGAAAVLMFAFADATTALIAPGFEGAQRELYVDLFRVMLLTPILFAASLTLGQVLLAEQRFFWYGVAPLLYNGGIIAGTLLLSDTLGIYGPAIGAVIGATLHLATRFIGLRPSRFRIGLGRSFRTAAVREFVWLMLPKMASHPVESMTFLFFTRVATLLAAGSVVAVDFARNFQGAPVQIIGFAFALAAFPALSTAHAEANRRGFLRVLGTNVLSIAVLSTVAAIVLALVAELAIRVLLGGGRFGERDIALTSLVLVAFAISIPFESLTHLLSRAIYATRHTLLQVLSSLASLGITVIATLALVPTLDVVAIPIGFAIGQGAKVVLLGIALGWRMRSFGRGAAVPEVSGAGAGLA